MRQKWVLLVLGVAAVCAGYHMISSQSAFVPDGMVGRWAARSPRYEGCYLELSSVSVIYGTAQGTVDVNFVQSVEKQVEGNDSLYRIHYKNRAGEEGKIDLLWNPLDQEIRLKSQREMSWQKVGHPS